MGLGQAKSHRFPKSDLRLSRSELVGRSTVRFDFVDDVPCLLGFDGSPRVASLSFCRMRFSETGKAVPRDWAKSDNAYSSIDHAMSVY